MADIVDYRWSPNQQLYRTTRTLLTPPLRWFFRATWTGMEHVPPHGPVVLACNHLSNLDPVLLGAACPRQINYLAKIELFRLPVLGKLIGNYGAIPLKRTASDPEAMRLAERVLEQGQLLALFPEGTRSRDGQLRPFRFGAARLSLKYGAALVPTAIVGTDQAMPAGATFPKRVTVRMMFGEPLDTTPYRYGNGKTPEPESLEEVTRMLQEKVQQLKTMLE